MVETQQFSPAEHLSDEDVLQQAIKLGKQNEPEAAIKMVFERYEQLKHRTEAQYVLGHAFFQLENYIESARHFELAVAKDPNNFNAIYQLAAIYEKLQDHHTAIKYFNQAIKLKPDHHNSMFNMGCCLFKAGRAELALKCFHSVLEGGAAETLPVYDRMAQVYDGLGEREKAEEFYEKSMATWSNDITKVYNFAYFKKHPLDSEAMQKLQEYELKHRDTPDDYYCYACYGVAKIYEDNKEHDKAFEFYERANLASHELYPDTGLGYHEWVDTSKRLFNSPFLQQHRSSGFDSNVPIFIVGMPRSGTTLTAQILGSHSKVCNAGELEQSRRLFTVEVPKITGLKYPHGLEKMPAEFFTKMGAHYVQSVQSYGGPGIEHIVDKMPGNMLYVGMLKVILPNAKIIHCTRDPMDTCWSLWRQGYIGLHNYKNTFDGLARFYACMEDLANYWTKKFPGEIYEANYEELIDNPRESMKKLLEFCGLEWEDNCENFHNTKSFVTTASIHQVNKPLYKSAIRSWEPYKEKLRPLQDALKLYLGQTGDQ